MVLDIVGSRLGRRSQQRASKGKTMRANTKTADAGMAKDASVGLPKRASKSVRTNILKVDKAWFDARMKELGYRKFAEVARQLGIERSIYHKSLGGERAFTVKEVLDLAKVLETTPEEICRRIGYDVPVRGVPVVGTVRDDGAVSTVTERKGSLFQMLNPPEGAQALIGQMTSAALSAHNGATFVYSKPIVGSDWGVLGQLCVVEASPHVTPYLGTLTKGVGRGKIALETLNGKRIDLGEVHRVSPVILIYFP